MRRANSSFLAFKTLISRSRFSSLGSSPLNLTLKTKNESFNTEIMTHQSGKGQIKLETSIQMIRTSQVLKLAEDSLKQNQKLDLMFLNHTIYGKQTAFESILGTFGILDGKGYNEVSKSQSYTINEQSSPASKDLIQMICQIKQLNHKANISASASQSNKTCSASISLLKIFGKDEDGSNIQIKIFDDGFGPINNVEVKEQ